MIFFCSRMVTSLPNRRGELFLDPFQLLFTWYQFGIYFLIGLRSQHPFLIMPHQAISCDRDSGHRPPKKKDRVAKLHYITRHVRNGRHLFFKVLHIRHQKFGCNEHFNIKRSRRHASDTVYGVSKFNLSRNLWNFEICYFGLRMLSSSFCFFCFSTQRFL